jgi:hypothetical protein
VVFCALLGSGTLTTCVVADWQRDVQPQETRTSMMVKKTVVDKSKVVVDI